MKEKYHIEYVFDKVSRKSLWRQISSPGGLSEWFAKRVEEQNGTYTFVWGDHGEESAKLVDMTEGKRIRFRWLKDENEKTYFEFLIHDLEITGGRALEITDFAGSEERSDAIDLWDTLVERLQISLGIT